jgi:hypothetical protein
MADDRLYMNWDGLGVSLKTGKSQTEFNEPLFEGLYRSNEKLKTFHKAMNGVQARNFAEFANKFDFSRYKSHCDIGGGTGLLSIQVCQNNKTMSCLTFDMKPVEGLAKEMTKKSGIDVKVVSGDFFKDPIPKCDVITMGNILHDWDLDKKKLLMKKVYDSLPQGGSFVVIEDVIDDERRVKTSGLLMSLNMLIETGSGFNFSYKDFDSWAKEIGFRETYSIDLAMGSSLVAVK